MGSFTPTLRKRLPGQNKLVGIALIELAEFLLNYIELHVVF